MNQLIWDKALININPITYENYSDGQEFLNALKNNPENPPIFIFTDNEMPRMTGPKAIKKFAAFYLKYLFIYARLV